jgi:integrase
VKTWEKTKLQNLVRHKSGRYYARLFLNGKEIWKSLKTSHFSVAEARLAITQKEHKERKSRESASSDATMTFGDVAKLHISRLEEAVTIKRRTKLYWKCTLVALLKSWPKLEDTELRKLTPTMCREWAASYSKISCGSLYNNSLPLLRHVIEVGIESGALYANPAIGLERKSVKSKQLELPSLEQFTAFIEEMRRASSRDSQNCADFAEGLAYTGCRVGESAHIQWCDLDFKTGEILVKGDPQEGTKMEKCAVFR